MRKIQWLARTRELPYAATVRRGRIVLAWDLSLLVSVGTPSPSVAQSTPA
jgi:hypothetical protein